MCAQWTGACVRVGEGGGGDSAWAGGQLHVAGHSKTGAGWWAPGAVFARFLTQQLWSVRCSALQGEEGRAQDLSSSLHTCMLYPCCFFCSAPSAAFVLLCVLVSA